MLAAAATLWALWSAWFLFPLMGVPALLRRSVTWLLAAQFVTLVAWAAARDGCTEDPCGPAAAVARTVATQDLPALAALVGALAAGHAMRARRRSATTPGRSPRRSRG